MIEPRIYRAAFLPAVLALVLTAFSLGNRPTPAPQGLAADVLFDGRLATATLREIVRDHPDRRPGTPGDEAVARDVGRRLASGGFTVTIEPFRAEGKRLRNVVARRTGASRRTIVILADRDAASVPDATGSAASTAALVELARVLKGRTTAKTVVLVSTDGGTLGDAGARRFEESVADRGEIEAVIALSDLAVAKPDGPVVVQWSNDSVRGSIGVARTAQASLRQEIDALPKDEGPVGQLSRLAFPVGIGPQGVLLEGGVPALRISGSGELPPPEGETGLARVDTDRLGALGRGALRTASALDGAPVPASGPESYLLTRKVLPGWTIALLAIALLLPALLASIDALARASRRRERIRPWWRWLGFTILPFLIGLAASELIVLLGWAPNTPSAAEPPAEHPLDGAAAGVLLAVVAVIGLSFWGGRWWIRRSRRKRVAARGARAGSAARALLEPRGAGLDRAAPQRPGGVDPAEAGAACTVSLALSVAAILIWAVNPYAALLLVPAVHIWMLVMLAERPLRLAGAAVALIAGVALPALLGVLFLIHLDLNPLAGVWYVFLLVTGHQVGFPSAVLGCVALGLFSATAAVLGAKVRRPRRDRTPGPPRPPIAGPGGYVGPGSLGGTGSALPRQ